MQLFSDLWFMKSFQLWLALGAMKRVPSKPKLPASFCLASPLLPRLVGLLGLCQFGRFKSHRAKALAVAHIHHSVPKHIFICIPLRLVSIVRLDWTVWRSTPTPTHRNTLPDTLKQWVCVQGQTLLTDSFLPSLPRLSHIFHSFASVGVE